MIIKANGKEYELATDINDVSLPAYLGYQKYYDELAKLEKKIQDALDDTFEYNPDKESRQILTLMAKAVSAFLELPENEIIGIPVGDFENYFDLTKKLPKSMHTIRGIFWFIANMISNYRSEIKENQNDFEFEHICSDGVSRKFVVHGYHRLGAQDMLFSETLEILEAQRIATTLKGSQSEMNGLFTEKIMMVAVMAKEPGEVWPEKQSEIDILIKSKAELLKNIGAKTVIQIGFFLTSIGAE